MKFAQTFVASSHLSLEARLVVKLLLLVQSARRLLCQQQVHREHLQRLAKRSSFENQVK